MRRRARGVGVECKARRQSRRLKGELRLQTREPDESDGQPHEEHARRAQTRRTQLAQPQHRVVRGGAPQMRPDEVETQDGREAKHRRVGGRHKRGDGRGHEHGDDRFACRARRCHVGRHRAEHRVGALRVEPDARRKLIPPPSRQSATALSTVIILIVCAACYPTTYLHSVSTHAQLIYGYGSYDSRYLNVSMPGAVRSCCGVRTP